LSLTAVLIGIRADEAALNERVRLAAIAQVDDIALDERVGCGVAHPDRVEADSPFTIGVRIAAVASALEDGAEAF
jgi:hypothetical protein